MHRCKRTTAFLTCKTHVLQPFLAAGAVIAAVAGIAQITGKSLSDVFEPAPETAATCYSAISGKWGQDDWLTSWFCDAKYSSIWKAPPTVFDSNRTVMQKNWSYLDPNVKHTKMELTAQSIKDLETDAPLIRRLFMNAAYNTKFSYSVGQVRRYQTYQKAPQVSSWLFQLGTGQDQSILIYGEVQMPLDWKPPAGDGCALAWFEGIPIAEGMVDRAGAAGELQVFYFAFSNFQCFPKLDDTTYAQLMKELTTEEEYEAIRRSHPDLEVPSWKDLVKPSGPADAIGPDAKVPAPVPTG